MRVKWVPWSFSLLMRCLWRGFATDLLSAVFSCVGQRVRRATSVKKLAHLLGVLTTEALESKKLGLSFWPSCSCFKSFSCVLKYPKWAYYIGKPVKNASFAGGENWKVVAERMGFTAPEIRYLAHRTRNPFEAALMHYIERNPMKVDDLYDILTECGMPMLADILSSV